MALSPLRYFIAAFEVKETTHAETVDTAMAGWFITAEIPNDLLFDEAKIDAFMK